MRSPDAAWLSWPRWNSFSPKERNRFGHFVPDFIVELRSESANLRDFQEKMRMWIAKGVELAWLVIPERRAVEVYPAGEEPQVFENPTSVMGTGPVSEFCLVMDRVWE